MRQASLPLIAIALISFIDFTSTGFAVEAGVSAPPNPPAPAKEPKIPLRYVRGVFLKATGKQVVLGEEELVRAIQDLGKMTAVPDRIKDAQLKDADRNRDGTVDWFEFQTLMETPVSAKKVSPNQPLDVQQKSDSQPEVQSVARSFQLPGPTEEFANWYADDPELHEIALNADLDRDGTLTRDEFVPAWDKIRDIAGRRYVKSLEDRTRKQPVARNTQPVPLKESYQKRVERMRGEVLRKHDANENGVLDDLEWKEHVSDERRARRDKHDSDGDGKLSDHEKAGWLREDNFLVWNFSFDKDRDGVLDDGEHAELSRRFAENPASITRNPPPLREELEAIE